MHARKWSHGPTNMSPSTPVHVCRSSTSANLSKKDGPTYTCLPVSASEEVTNATASHFEG
eukprot:11205221-Lingulodinium_polyedra.AAC.1